MSGWLTAASVLAILVLTAGTALFVAAEFSLTALERSTVDANARTGGRADKFVQRAHRTLSFQLSGAQIGISITTLATGYLAEPVVGRMIAPSLDLLNLPPGLSGGLSLALALIIATSLSMVFGELVPKNIAVALPAPTARAVAAPQLFFAALFTPAIKATNGAANWVVRRMGIEPAEELRSARSPQELVSLVRTSADAGSIDAATAALMNRSLRFGELDAEELMTPRSKIVTLDADQSVADLVTAACETGFSRFPIVDGDLDATVGIVHVKQVFEIAPADRAQTPLARLAQPVPVVPATLDGDAVMTQVRANGLQTAMVVDEYGGTAGMVTVEDLIEEIIGDVRDEHDDRRPDVLETDGSWQVSGLLRIDEVAAATGYRAPESEHYETIGGLVITALGHLPVAGESVELPAFEPDGHFDDPIMWLATVVAMDGRRIDVLELSELGPRSRRASDEPEAH